ncbi:unnamed protein product, partial [Ilex paraguariensis]
NIRHHTTNTGLQQHHGINLKRFQLRSAASTTAISDQGAGRDLRTQRSATRVQPGIFEPNDQGPAISDQSPGKCEPREVRTSKLISSL